MDKSKEQYNFQIEIQRRHIDDIDRKLYLCLLNRMMRVHNIGEIKKEFGEDEMSVERRDEIYEKLKGWAIDDGLPVSLVNNIYDTIFEFSRLEQFLIING